MKTYLITGGAGFIGSNFIIYMFEKYGEKIRIINVDKLTYAGNLDNLKQIKDMPDYIFLKADICDSKEILRIFEQYDIDCLVNFAAESHVDRSINDQEQFIRTNILGTYTLLNIFKKFWDCTNNAKREMKFIQISTDEVYGSISDNAFFTEGSPINPQNPYAVSKASADLLVKSYFDTYKLPVNITRCTNNFGPHQNVEKLIPLVINNCLKHIKIPVYGDGKNVRDWIYVEDHCKAIDLVLHHGINGEIYNIGCNNEWQNNQLIELIINRLNTLISNNNVKELITYDLIEFVKDRLNHDRRYAIDSTKVRLKLGWNPKIKFDDCIDKTIKWYMNEALILKN